MNVDIRSMEKLESVEMGMVCLSVDIIDDCYKRYSV